MLNNDQGLSTNKKGNAKKHPTTTGLGGEVQQIIRGGGGAGTATPQSQNYQNKGNVPNRRITHSQQSNRHGSQTDMTINTSAMMPHHHGGAMPLAVRFENL
jgi:hypothetical protein